MLPPTLYDPAVMNVSVAAAAQAGADPSTNHAWKNGSFSFHDILDTINPLQHIPLVGTLYRWITGDEPGNVARIVGDGIYGGPVGLGIGMMSTAFEEETGKDPGAAVIAALTGEDNAKVTLGAASAQPAGTAPPAAATPAAATAATGAAATNAPPTVGRAGPMVVPAAARPPAISAGPPHPFLPLFRSPPALAPTASSANPSEQAFMSENANYQRSLYGQRGAAAPQTAVIPLQLTGPQLPGTQPFAPARPAAPAASASPAVVPAPVATTAAPAAPAPAPGAASASALPQVVAPAEIPQRMLDALDKYSRMQQQQAQPRGQQVDVAP